MHSARRVAGEGGVDVGEAGGAAGWSDKFHEYQDFFVTSGFL